MILSGKWVVTFQRGVGLVEDGAVLVEGNVIKDVGPKERIVKENPGEDIIEFPKSVIMPGLICAHCHAYGAFARGMPLKVEPPTRFVEILERIWWHLDKRLTLDDVYYSGLVTAIEAVRHGTTTMFDHHASPFAITGSLERLAEAFRKVGVRANIAYEVSDRDGLDRAEEGTRENVEFIKRHQGDEFITGSFGLHAQLTLSDETLEKVVEAAKGLDTGFHIHVAEGVEDVFDSLKKSGRRVVERLWGAGILGEKTIAAHCVHTNERELRILKDTGTNVVHNPESNMNNAVGVAPVVRMMELGIRPALGTDGFTMDMFREAKVAYTLHKLHMADPRVMGADKVLEMLYHNNSELAAKYFTKPLGKIVPGAFADLMVLSYRPYTPVHEGNFPWHFIFGMDASHVTDVVVDGKFVVRNGELLTVDEEQIFEEAKELAQALWDRL
ncbi:MAG: putative aminohydrolase SsnA [Candidatus Korarchaeota archaeon]|nr:putative aminohydrolase SsnA [Candidatus Korarchaeota archaeon]